eukprot:CAMPEP_0183321980 /NCGR_PEP_ID=MMETSP0160_2-20130417/70357_1 /TAXON_ID=2839 ORGANISM="Odontella Sinensis, Strain Grunow 1884" /NCGR_SAMPLE_ID=MMETSP0160_2 /ASSEMBLY_ACC=CAM_ASM_000250 /LENGTH=102 /DNA_ID=CAMNT_0025489033 /DNA_START=459 /DNA_END=763 /DNA_ORIENTATION=+
MDRMNKLPAHSAPVHALVLRHGPPIPPLRRELHGVPLRVLVKLHAVGPEPLPHPVGVLRPHGDRNDAHRVAEGESVAEGVTGGMALRCVHGLVDRLGLGRDA